MIVKLSPGCSDVRRGVLRHGAWVLGSALVPLACSSDVAQSDAPGETPPAGVASSSPPARAANASPDPAAPEGLPSGWLLDRRYDERCGLYVPPDATHLPAAVAWEPCPSNASPAGARCRLMRIDWETSNTALPGAAEAAWMSPSGAVILGAYRYVKPGWVYSLIAEADGAVRSAMLATRPLTCAMGRTEIADARYTMAVGEGSSGLGGGLLAGSVDELSPRYFLHLDATAPHHPFPAAFAVIDFTAGFAFNQYDWMSGTPLGTLWSASADDGAQQQKPVFASGAGFWGAGDLAYHKIHAYRAGGAVVDLLSAGTDANHGYDDPGADGHDLVWIEAHAANRTSTWDPFDTYSIMTSPVTTDPAAIVARRLRSEQGPAFGASPFRVGCGYAARANGYHIRIVRLADGWSWKLATDITSSWSWAEPLGLSCVELFATVNAAGQTRLARVTIDSLGPGEAPD